MYPFVPIWILNLFLWRVTWALWTTEICFMVLGQLPTGKAIFPTRLHEFNPTILPTRTTIPSTMWPTRTTPGMDHRIYHLGGGGHKRFMYPHEHYEHETELGLSAGVQGLLKGPGSSRVVYGKLSSEKLSWWGVVRIRSFTYGWIHLL